MDYENVKKIFLIFEVYYGKTWNESRDDAAWQLMLKVWGSALNPFSGQIVEDAVNRACKKHTTYPPTLGALLEICTTLKRESDSVSASQKRYRVNSLEDLAKHSGGSEVAQQEMAKIRRILGGEKIFDELLSVRYDRLRAKRERYAEEWLARIQIRPESGSFV